MACNCNNANPNCEPCAICTPPGVTGLTTCQPVDPCEKKVPLECVLYSGQEYDCDVVVNTNDTLLSIFSSLFEKFKGFSPTVNQCCTLTGAIIMSTTTTTAGPTTTTTSSTTTTTTQAPTCSFYNVTNTGAQSPGAVISYVPCNTTIYRGIPVTINVITICINNTYPITTVSGTVTSVNVGVCNTPAPPTTTSTTTAAPCTCGTYRVVNNSGSTYTITYTECNNGRLLVTTSFNTGTTNTVCACSNIIQGTPPTGVVITNLSINCSVSPTTTTTTIDCTNSGGNADQVETMTMQAVALTQAAVYILANTVDVYINWGDGTIDRIASTHGTILHNYATPYTGNITYLSKSLATITQFYDQAVPVPGGGYQAFTGTSLTVTTSEFGKLKGLISTEVVKIKMTGDVTYLPKSLKYLVVWANNTLSGNVLNLPRSLYWTNILGANTLTGTIANFPRPVVTSGGYGFTCEGANTISGNITDLPTTSYSGCILILQGNNTIIGDIINIPANYTNIFITGNNALTGDIANFKSALIGIGVLGYNTLYGNIQSIKAAVTYFSVNGLNYIGGTIASVTSSVLETLSVEGRNNITGSIVSLYTAATALKTLTIIGNNTISGNISGLSRPLVSVNLGGNNTVTGVLSGLSTLTVIEAFYVSGSNTVSGDIGSLPTTIRGTAIEGSNTVNAYTTPHTWSAAIAAVTVKPVTALSSTITDNLLIDLNAVPMLSGVIRLKGSTTSASNVAKAALIARGIEVTITT